MPAVISDAAFSYSEVKRHEFQVEMTCEGCSGAVNRVLNKKGIKILLG